MALPITTEPFFPDIPESFTEEQKEYLQSIEDAVSDLVRKSEVIDAIYEKGILGN